MKVWILTLLIGAAVAAPSFEVHHRQTRNVASLIQDIVEETGIKDLLPWIQEVIQTDPDVKNFIAYLTSGQFDAILTDLKACPGYDVVKDKLAKEGVDLVKIIEDIRNFVAGKSRYYKIQPRKSLGELLNEFLARMDLNRVIEVIKDKFDNDPDMKKIIDFVKSDTFQKLATCMKDSKAVKELVEKLKEEDIDLESLIEMIKMLFGNGLYYQIETRTVGELLHNLIKDLGLMDLLPWIRELIDTDPDAQRVVEYLKGPAFKRIEDHLKQCPGYQETKDKLKDEGIDLAEILEKIRNFITGGSYHAKSYKIQPRRTLGELLDMILEKLDVDKMIAIIKEKYSGNPDLKKVIAFLRGDVFNGIRACMRENQDVKDLIKKLEDEGVDVQGIISLVEALLEENSYYSIQSRTVGELLQNLITDLGLRDLLPWIRELIDTDPDAQRVVEYLKGPAFKRIEDHLKQCPGYQETKDKLKDEGVDLAEILEKIRNFITGGSYHAKSYKIQPRRTLGELLDMILEKLEVDKMIAIIKEKYHGNPDLKKVIAFLRGDVFNGIRACMRENQDVKDLIKKLEDEGVDVQGIISLVEALLEENSYYSIQSRTVGELLESLIQELGLRDLLPWIRELIDTDPDAQRVIEYLKSPAFKRIEEHLKQCPGYQETKDKLKAEGVDLVELLEKIRNFITGGSHYYKIQPRRNLGELLDAILEKLDIDNMIAIVREKFHGNPDLKKVIDFLKGDVFKGIRACMRESQDVKDLLAKLEEEGVDVQGIIDLLENLLANA